MKKINCPAVDDDNELDKLAGNKKLGSYPELQNNSAVIKQQYQEYLNKEGDAWAMASCNLPAELQTSLKAHYGQPPKDRLQFLDELRRNLSPDICPMCGGLGTGTIDHYLPKNNYAEFAIFSKNLIPACSCNSLRKTTVKGDLEPERVIHPYYDKFLEDRLYQAVFEGDYKTPSISVKIENINHPQIEILKFHLEEVVLKNHIISWLEKRWGDLSRRPHKILGFLLPKGEIDGLELKTCICSYVEVKDDEYETPNNWWSIFYYGLKTDQIRLDRLAYEINILRN